MPLKSTLSSYDKLQLVRDFFTDYCYLDHIVGRESYKKAEIAKRDKKIITQRIEVIYDALLSIHEDGKRALRKAESLGDNDRSQMEMLASLHDSGKLAIDPRDVIELNPILQKLAADKVVLDREERELLYDIKSIISRANTALEATNDTLDTGNIILSDTTIKIQKGIEAAKKILAQLDKEVQCKSDITMEMILKHFAKPKNYGKRHKNIDYQYVVNKKNFAFWCAKSEFNGLEYEPEFPHYHSQTANDSAAREPYAPIRTDNIITGPSRKPPQLEDQSKSEKSKKFRAGWIKNVATSAALLATGAGIGYKVRDLENDFNAPKAPESNVRQTGEGDLPGSIKILRDEGPVIILSVRMGA